MICLVDSVDHLTGFYIITNLNALNSGIKNLLV